MQDLESRLKELKFFSTCDREATEGFKQGRHVLRLTLKKNLYFCVKNKLERGKKQKRRVNLETVILIQVREHLLGLGLIQLGLEK